ncbi:MAG: hypothetical protein A2Z21_02205 [Candidatus Fraserbacteria bacterium RBG_16_55_9]|uniref:NurA domain-containing protein n=1 Tax=Fraserbacteria sp. (strain RBG_16_55_9) TaxID=1817864 RepID=A0A1F5V334_FRAXR|nr:MAG: hypothetical protein A2Z21_02205 [Candidatus Fraserbacteria bacterium RBG_16_55_9]
MIMLSNEAKQTLRNQLKAFGEQVQRLSPNHRAEARQLFEKLQLKGAIQALTPLEYCSQSVLELASRSLKEYEPTYAIDGGSTRLQRLENGTLVCAYQAVLSSDPDTRYKDLPLEAFRSLSLVSHSQRTDLGGAKSQQFPNEYVHFWRVHISRTYLEHEVERVVGSLARMAAESYHALRMLKELSPKQGLFIVDGNLYPIGLYYYLTGEDDIWPEENGPKTSWTEWKPAIEILAQPVRVVEAFRERGLALVGLNKNPGTSWLLEFTLDRESHNWSNDAQFIRAVLSGTPKDALGYTNWFVQEGYSLPQRRGESVESFDIFERLSSFGLLHAPKAYHVCFFYLFDPRVKAVLKVEAPRIVFEKHDPEKLRAQVLAEIAQGKGVPPAIRRADSRARITEEESASLIRACGVELDLSYNQSRSEMI